MSDSISSIGRGGQLLKDHGLWLTAVLTVIVFFGLFIYSDGAAVLTALKQFPPSQFLLILGLTTIGYGFRFAKWEFYLRSLDVDIPLRSSLIAFFSGLMMVITPGKAGEVWKAWFLRDTEGVPASHTTSVVGAERITDLLALSVLALLGILIYSQSSTLFLGVLCVLIFGIVLLQWRSFCLRCIRLCDNIPLLSRYTSEIELFYNNTYALFQFRPLAVALVLSIIAWGLEGIALLIALEGVGLDANVLVAVFIFGLGSVVGAISMLPGGLIATEASMVGLLVSFGYGKTAATVAVILVRVGTLWYAAVLGIIVFLSYKARR